MRIGGLLNYHLYLSLFFLIGKCKLEIALSQEHLPKKLRPERREENEKSVALREKNVILMNGILRVWFVPYQKSHPCCLIGGHCPSSVKRFFFIPFLFMP